MKKLGYCIALLVISITFGICLAVTKELAKVDGLVITDSDLTKRINQLPERGRVSINKEKFLNKMIDEELLLREAQKLNFHDREDYILNVETFKRELLVNLFLQQLIKDKNTEEGQKKYYEANIEKYKNPEMVKISVITVKSEDEAKEILNKAKKGGDFAELAMKYSQGPAAKKGGDFGFRAKKGLRKDFADAAFSMKVGEVSGLIKAGDEYNIIKVTDHKEGGVAKFEQVKNKIASEYAHKLIEEKISELRKAVKIQIDSAELKNLTIK
ncbi:MAG: peptidyl-prolyl cis-trans isomerase [Nitrospirota bacterium]